MAERVSRLQRAQLRGSGVVAAREAAAHEGEPTHPILALQRTVGNQAVQRLLMRSSGDRNARWTSRIRRLIADIDKADQASFESIENALRQSPGREGILPLVRNMKVIHQANGILTVEMVSMLRRAIGPLHPDREERFIDKVDLALMTKRVALKAEAIEALHSDDPGEWYMDFIKRSPYDVPVYHYPAD